MSHSSKRGSDILDYIAKLNQIPSESDVQSPAVDQFKLEKNLAMFSNAQFFDFDLGHDADLQSSIFEPTTDLSMPLHDIEYSFTKFGTFPTPFDPQDASHENLSDNLTNTLVAPCSAITSPMSCTDNFAGKPQMSNASSPSVGTEISEMSRQVAEEDKRRRNTAASARFRVKKKQREQALEKSAKEMSSKVAKFEDRIKMLETENKWLKDLIIAKNADRTLETRLDLESFWTHQLSQESPSGQRSDGVRNENFS